MNDKENLISIDECKDYASYYSVLKEALYKKFRKEWVDGNIDILAEGFELGRKFPDEQTIKRILALQYLWTNTNEGNSKTLYNYIVDKLTEEKE